MAYINLKTPIPGPKSQELQARRAAAVTAARPAPSPPRKPTVRSWRTWTATP